jgi:hypothetical protein
MIKPAKRARTEGDLQEFLTKVGKCSESKEVGDLFSVWFANSNSDELTLDKLLSFCNHTIKQDKTLEVLPYWLENSITPELTMKDFMAQINPHFTFYEYKVTAVKALEEVRIKIGQGPLKFADIFDHLLKPLKNYEYFAAYLKVVKGRELSLEEVAKLLQQEPNMAALRDDLYYHIKDSEELHKIVKKFYTRDTDRVKFLQHLITRGDQLNFDQIFALILKDKCATDLFRHILDSKENTGSAFLETVALCEGRFASKYPFLANVFDGKGPEEFLTAEYLKSFKKKHGLEAGSKVPNQILDFLSLDKKNFTEFAENLKPAFKDRALDVFVSSSKNLILAPWDVTTSCSILGFSAEELKDQMILNKNYCKYFAEKITINHVLEDDIPAYKIDFSDSVIDGVLHDELNEKVRKALASDSSDGEIFDFLNSLVVALGGEELSQENTHALVGCWNTSVDAISTILAQAAGPRNINNALSTITDGCSANIGTQLSMAAYRAILDVTPAESAKEKSVRVADSILLNILCGEIVPTIFGGDGDLINVHSNPLRHSVVRSHFLVPDNLEKKISANLNAATASDLVKGLIGVESHQALQGNIADELDSQAALSQQGAAMELPMIGLASYLVIKSTLGTAESTKLSSSDAMEEMIENIGRNTPSLSPIVSREPSRTQSLSHGWSTGSETQIVNLDRSR